MSWSHKSGSYERPLGDSEFAFFPASQNGLGDMFLHLALRAPKKLILPDRVRIAWAIIRRHHPLLMSKVILDGDDLNTARFSFIPPKTSNDALKEAASALVFKHETKEDLISNFMNGPRSLSNDHISYLCISTPSPSPSSDDFDDYDLLMCAPHFTGDGTSLHRSTHDLIVLLSSNRTNADLLRDLDTAQDWDSILPLAYESRLSEPPSLFAKAASKVNFLKTLEREIGGHTFTRVQHAPQRTIFFERVLTKEQSATILARCKANGVTINHVLSALCSVAWARGLSSRDSMRLPMMMYTAANLRPHLSQHPSSTYWFLALTYFNLVLPAFPPHDSNAFWHRARLAKTQTHRAVRSPFLVSRALEMATTRASRARGTPASSPPAKLPPHAAAAPAPSAALLGLSMIGNLDATYDRSAYGPGVVLREVTTASRQKPGGMLLLAHTFGGCIWFQLAWDASGFAEGQVEGFWNRINGVMEEYIL